MKRILISALSALLCVSMVACGNKNTDDKSSETTTGGNDIAETTTTTEATTPAETEPQIAIVEPDVDAKTPGGKMWQAFLSAKQEKPEASAEELANQLLAAGVIPQEIMMGAMALEANQEFFNGFDNYKITGYESGALFMPMIGATPIMGYVFELADGADVDAFIKALCDNANLRWNVCTAAEQMTAGAYENTVFFFMSPLSFEQQ